MKIEEGSYRLRSVWVSKDGLYRLRAVWVSTDGETRVHYDRQLCEEYNDLRKWKEDTLKMLEGYGGVVSSCTIEPYKT